MPYACPLDHRAVLKISGSDRVTYLQGLISNDVEKLSSNKALWAAFLTPQGKYLHDFFLIDDGEAILLEGEKERLADLHKRLRIYRLRSEVELEEADPALAVIACWGDGALAALSLPEATGAATTFAGGKAFVDPRSAALGARAILPAAQAMETLTAAGFEAGEGSDYEHKRLALAVPDGSRDLEVEKSILLENGFDELGAIDWDKGCWMGQELTARTRYRALIKRRLLPAKLDGEAPPRGTLVLQGERQVGELRSSSGNRALVLLRLDALDSGEALTAGGLSLNVELPGWLKLPEASPRPRSS